MLRTQAHNAASSDCSCGLLLSKHIDAGQMTGLNVLVCQQLREIGFPRYPDRSKDMGAQEVPRL